MDTIKVTDLVNRIASEIHLPALLVHMQLQQAAQRLGMGWDGRIDTVSAVLIEEEAASKAKWTYSK